MRVLIATNMYPTADAPYLGAFVRQQELSLRALGVEVEVAAHIGRNSRWEYPKGLWALARRLRGGRFDLIHSHHTYSTILAHFARRLAGVRVPMIETFHESEIFQRGTDFGQDPLRRLKYVNGIKAWALRRVDFAIPVQRDMLRVAMGEAAAARVPSRVIPAGIDLEAFRPEPVGEVRARLGWALDETVVFFPCDPGKPEKRADLARAAFEIFSSTHPHSRLVVGGGIPYAQMPDTIKAADVILSPTDYEASPTIIKESLACERPVVSTDVGDVRECYEGLPGVFLCDWDPGDIAAKLGRAVAAPSPYGGRERLQKLGLGVEQVARRVLEVYREVLNGVPRRLC